MTLWAMIWQTVRFAAGLAIVVLMAAFLFGCATLDEPLPEIREVRIHVPVPCLKEALERPKFVLDGVSDEELRERAKLNDYRLLMRLYQERAERQTYERILEAAVAGCSIIPQ